MASDGTHSNGGMDKARGMVDGVGMGTGLGAGRGIGANLGKEEVISIGQLAEPTLACLQHQSE